MMAKDDTPSSMSHVLQKEAQAWSELAPPDYDRAVCELFKELAAAHPLQAQAAAWLALASATLRRDSLALVDARACCAEGLLALLMEPATSVQRPRLQQLFLLAWLRLGAVAENGPETINVTPDLPEGVVMVNGVDPSAIADPTQRAQYLESIQRHAEAVDRWSLKQAALRHLYKLYGRFQYITPVSAEEQTEMKELAVAMALAPGLPADLQQMLKNLP